MAQGKNLQLLKITLAVFAVIALVYGLLYLFVPQVLVNASGGEPVQSGWLRWSGGILISLGVGSIMVIRKPLNQGIFVTTVALGTLLCGLALLHPLFFDEITNFWFTASPAIVNLIISALLWISLKQAKTTLCGEIEK